ncbi:MAG: hypothetical protein HRT54_18955 [Colwellia sp.]|nr:hypothetical protein [Colwellia sp.]
MCSTPRPKRAEKVKSTPRVVSIMASMDAEARHRFTERANEASKRKEAVRQEKKLLCLAKKKETDQRKNQKMLNIKQQNQGLGYWLFSASFADIFKKLTSGQ